MAESIYFYNPSLAASILFIILYTFPFIYHFYLSIIAPYTQNYPRAAYYIPVMIGAMIEVGAYGVRAASVKQPDSIPLYAVSSSLVVIAPVFICASLYILIGRLIRSNRNAGDSRDKNGAVQFGKVSSSWIPGLFVASDVISLLMQASGSAIGGSNDWKGQQKDVGVDVLIAGLALQLVTFSLFLLLVGWFDMKASPRYSGDRVESGVRLVLTGIYIAGFFIMVSDAVLCIRRILKLNV